MAPCHQPCAIGGWLTECGKTSRLKLTFPQHPASLAVAFLLSPTASHDKLLALALAQPAVILRNTRRKPEPQPAGAEDSMLTTPYMADTRMGNVEHDALRVGGCVCVLCRLFIGLKFSPDVCTCWRGEKAVAMSWRAGCLSGTRDVLKCQEQVSHLTLPDQLQPQLSGRARCSAAAKMFFFSH